MDIKIDYLQNHLICIEELTEIYYEVLAKPYIPNLSKMNIRDY